MRRTGLRGPVLPELNRSRLPGAVLVGLEPGLAGISSGSTVYAAASSSCGVTTTDGGSPGVMSAVPTLSNTQAGTVWRPRAIPSSMAAAPLSYVACAGARYCVFAANRPGGGGDNLFVYTNTHPPVLELATSGEGSVDGGEVWLDEQQQVSLSFTPSDEDGDPVLVTASSPDLTGTPVSLSIQPLANDGLQVDLKAGTTCSTQDVGTLHVQVTDGLREHEFHQDLRLNVVHNQAPALPVVQLGDGGVVSPGVEIRLKSDAESLTLHPVSHTTAAGCMLTEKWTQGDAGLSALSLSHMGDDAVIKRISDYCEPDGGDAFYQLTVQDLGNMLSTDGKFIVHLESTRQPISSGASELTLDTSNPSVRVVAVTSDLNCGEERGLSADLRVTQVDGGEDDVTQVDGGGGALPSTTVSITKGKGTWSLPDSLGCRHYQLTGRLRDDTNEQSPLTPLDIPGQDAGLDPLPAQALVARCGEPAHTTLVATFPKDSCQTPKLTWTYQSGPMLVDRTLMGNSPTLVTQDTGLNTLVGQSVVLTVTADSGLNSVSTDYTLPITVDPFVKVSHRTEVPAASETGFVGVFTDLKNTTACDVTDVSYSERLEGLTYVEGSARFNGQEVAATWDDQAGMLSVSGLALAGNATETLTYLTRPHLVGDRHIQGEARLNTVPISLSEALPPVADSGCGCTSPAGSAPMLLALGTLMGAVRRRRRA